MTLISDTISAFGPGEVAKPHTPLWAIFDPEWYRVRYHNAILEMLGTLPDDSELFAFWKRDGARYAHSPNRFFDEIWYRRVHPDVEDGIRMGVFESGFQHYCETGYHGRSCHWLFSESDYFWLNQDLTPIIVRDQGYSNGYDHYLAVGQAERRVSSCFFVPDMFRTELLVKRLPYAPESGEFSRFLLSQDVTELRTSWYFDPTWYLDRYPAVLDVITTGEYASPLHHYLSNDTPTLFSPNSFFDETYYLERHPDVHELVRARRMRNGYEHFVKHGLFEGRSPAEGVSLPPERGRSEVLPWKRLCDNAFIASIRASDQGEAPLSFIEPESKQLEFLQLLKAETFIPLLARTPLDFRYLGTPELSVILAGRVTFPELLLTLTSLHEGNSGAMQVILVDAGAKDETAEIDRYVMGIEVMMSDSTDLISQWHKGATRLRACKTLVVEPGCHFYLGALAAAKKRLDMSGVIGVAPQCLGFDLCVTEAGLSVFRNGTCLSYGEGKAAFAPALDFVRACDTLGGGALLCHTEALRNCLPHMSELRALQDRRRKWAALGLSLRQMAPEARIMYEPCFLIRGPRQMPVVHCDSAHDTLIIRRFFADILRGNLPNMPALPEVLHRSARWGQRILILTQMGGWHCYIRSSRLAALSENLVAMGLQVTVFVLNEADEDCQLSAIPVPDVVERCSGTPAEFGLWIDQRARDFDRLWVHGGATLNAVFSLLSERVALLPEEGLTLDLRDLDHLTAHNDFRREELEIGPENPGRFNAQLCAEVHNAWFCQDIVVSDEAQAHLLRMAGLQNMTILGDCFPVHGGDTFHTRHHFLFSVQGHSDEAYERVFLEWFIREVLSRLDARLPPSVRLILACGTMHSRAISRVTHYHRVAPLEVGRQSFSALATKCRVMIVPDDCGGSTAFDRLAASACGLPVITGGGHKETGLGVGFPDPNEFAGEVIRLYQDADEWTSQSRKALAEAATITSSYRETLGKLVGVAFMKESERD